MEHITVGRKREVLCAIITNIHKTSFCGLTTGTNCAGRTQTLRSSLLYSLLLSVSWRLPECLLWPSDVEHLKVILNNANLLFLVCLVEVLQDDGDIHVDHNHVTNDDKTGEICDCQQGGTTVPIWLAVVRRVTVWWLHHQRLQHIIPSSRCHKPADRYIHDTNTLRCKLKLSLYSQCKGTVTPGPIPWKGRRDLQVNCMGLTAAYWVYKLYSLLIIILSNSIFVVMTLTNGSLSCSACKNSRLDWQINSRPWIYLLKNYSIRWK